MDETNTKNPIDATAKSRTRFAVLALAIAFAGFLANHHFVLVLGVHVPLAVRVSLALCSFTWVVLVPVSVYCLWFSSIRVTRRISHYVLWSNGLTLSCLSFLGWMLAYGFAHPFEIMRWAISPGWIAF
jgi:hypothetical protein